ncbi:hypothetical protein LPTSP3_g31000 [Leptospira kobayashii]|uniref:SIR2-like domain-containing protein n=1 Tax=Leptospira kobayashii TaxID=1917830 RepID=A0ABN6KHI0_9LEPT|nr:SIR2 family protein [Leptospira kobayashii]BDA80170.1 hypothetical protein LPTSP3_g31000 [Leptospira kobayashii]
MTIEFKTNKNVYILGAGFSVPAGIPTIDNFFDKTKEVLNSLDPNKDKRAFEAIKTLLELRFQSAAAAYWTKTNLDNIEELFSFISAIDEGYSLVNSVVDSIAITIEKLKSEPGNFGNKIYLEDFILNQKYQKFRRLDERAYAYLDFNNYQRIVASLLGNIYATDDDAENAFITFNYDTVLEETLNSLEIDYSYYLGKVSYETINTNYNESVSLLKLHGSVNWGFPGTRGSKLTIYKNSSECFQKSKSIAIIPPTWNKHIDGQTEKVWQQAVKELKTATRIIIIGFSFPETDNHVKYLLSAGLKDNISLRNVLFINPMEENEAKRKLSKVFSDSLFINDKVLISRTKIENFIDKQENLKLINRAS